MFPAVSLRDSYSHLPDALVRWWVDTTTPDWPAMRVAAFTLLEDAARAEAAARLVGTENLPERQQWLLAMVRLFEDAFLRQNALDPADGYCSPRRQSKLLHLLLHAHQCGMAALDHGAAAAALARLPVMTKIADAKSQYGDGDLGEIDRLETLVRDECDAAAATVTDHG